MTLAFTGCVNLSPKQSDTERRPFQITQIAKSDIDMVTESNIRTTMKLLHQLALKLYKRNPAQWRKAGYQSAEQATDAIFSGGRHDIKSLNGNSSINALSLTFDNHYQGDRVLALTEGLRTMILAAYRGKQRFYMLDDLDPQKIYNAARNIELAAWKLSNDRDQWGNLYLISNQLQGPVKNLSFERIFGKLIALQDSMAVIIADKSNRTIKNVIQSVARAVFLPI